MKKHTLSLVSLAAVALFSAGVSAQTAPMAQQTDRSFDFNNFYNTNKTADGMVSKEQYMMEMSRRWDMAEKMMGPDNKKGWASQANLRKAMQIPIDAKGAQ